MPSIDWPLSKLVDYQPELTCEPDFDAFWETTLGEARRIDLAPVLNVVDYPIKGVQVHELSYAGFDGHRVNGWYLLPRGTAGPVPTIICYHGYSGSAGVVNQHLPWVMMGLGVIAVDTRGQGGQTGDLGGYHNGTITGWMTQGLLDPYDYYYRRAYTDCVRAIDFAATREELDLSHLCVTGGSQGGGLTLAVAGLDRRVKVVMPDVPYLCHYQRAIDIAAAGPYQELQKYFAKYPAHYELALRTLSYHDGMNLASRINPRAKMLCSVGLWDDVCPPSTVFAAYNNCPVPTGQGSKEIAVYPFNKHEGGGPDQRERQIAFLHQALRAG